MLVLAVAWLWAIAIWSVMINLLSRETRCRGNQWMPSLCDVTVMLTNCCGCLLLTLWYNPAAVCSNMKLHSKRHFRSETILTLLSFACAWAMVVFKWLAISDFMAVTSLVMSWIICSWVTTTGEDMSSCVYVRGSTLNPHSLNQQEIMLREIQDNVSCSTNFCSLLLSTKAQRQLIKRSWLHCQWVMYSTPTDKTSWMPDQDPAWNSPVA